MPSLEQRILTHVDAILGPDGLIAHAITEDGKVLSHNPAQHEYARLAAIGFCRRDEKAQRTALNVLQAATGTGKTLGYLVPLMVYAAHTGERVAVSTYTRHLQRQVQEDAGIVQGWLSTVAGRTLRIARRVGRKNYVSANAIARLMDTYDVNEDHADLSFLSELMDWTEASDKHGTRLNSGILEDYLEEQGLGGVPNGISARGVALTPTDDEEESANYHRDIAASKNADLLIVNHALAMMNALRWGKLLDDERALSVMVFDEADRLPAAAESMLNADVTVHSALRLCETISQETGLSGCGDAMRSFHESIMAIKPSGSHVLSLSEGGAAASAVRAGMKTTLNVLRPLAKQWAVAGKTLKGVSGLPTELRDEFLDMVNDLESLAQSIDKQNEGVAIVSWSPVKAYPSLRLGQAEPGRLLSRMWASLKWESDDELTPPSCYLTSALFTSATLGVPGRPMPDAFGEFMSSIGIMHRPKKGENDPRHFIQADLFRSFEPASFGSMKFVLADPRCEDPFLSSDGDDGVAITSEVWLNYCASMIKAAKESGGRTLVLIGSFKDGLALKERLTDLGNDLVLHEQGHGMANYLEAFRKSRGGVLMSPSAWEGLDLPGVLTNIVITRIPNKRPDSIDLVLFKLALEKAGMAAAKIKGQVMGRISAEARRRLAQGFGRGIRKASDKVTVWIADPRFPLPEDVAQSLDPIVMAGLSRKVQTAMAQSIPLRFRKRAYPNAKILTLEGTLYTPEPL